MDQSGELMDLDLVPAVVSSMLISSTLPGSRDPQFRRLLLQSPFSPPSSRSNKGRTAPIGSYDLSRGVRAT